MVQQLEPNVGIHHRRESAYLGTRDTILPSTSIDPEVGRFFREYKPLFLKLMGDEFTSAEIIKMAMDAAIKKAKEESSARRA
jgi:hypothetical protein